MLGLRIFSIFLVADRAFRTGIFSSKEREHREHCWSYAATVPASKRENWFAETSSTQRLFFSSKLQKLACVLICCLVASGRPSVLSSIFVAQSFVTVYFIMVDLHSETQFPWRWRGVLPWKALFVCWMVSSPVPRAHGWARVCSTLDLTSEPLWKQSVCEPSLPFKTPQCSQHGSQFRLDVNVWSGQRREILKLDVFVDA